MTRFANRFSAAALAALLYATAFVAFAQVDDRARALLEGLVPPAGETVDTLQQTMVMTLHQQGDTQVRTTSIIDYVERRAAIDTEISEGMVVTVVIEDGQASMLMSGMALPLPPALTESFDGVFDRDPGELLAEGSTATYDGPVAYGDLLEGEQVTVSGASLVAGVEEAEESRYVFDGGGSLLGVVTEADGDLVVMVFDEPFTGSGVVGRNATLYLLDDAGTAERFATMAFEDVLVNEPIPEGTF
ncbi:MAG: hypothetical protein ABR510_10555 [Trueperaceae bacterium]